MAQVEPSTSEKPPRSLNQPELASKFMFPEESTNQNIAKRGGRKRKRAVELT